MFYGNDRNQMRNMFRDTWLKFKQQQPLQPLEKIIGGIIAMHPEYHVMLEQPLSDLDQDYTPEMGQSNPFLHMGMHIALQEQVSTNRPNGITTIHQQLCQRHDQHEAEHRMIECLGEMLWKSQQQGLPPDDSEYLLCLKGLV